MKLIWMNVYVVRDSSVVSSNKYPLAFGDGMIKQDLPPEMNCKWEEIAAFPTMESALCESDQGSRLMDVLAFLNSENFADVLQSTGFTIHGAERSFDVWARAVRRPNLAPQEDATICSVASGALSRGHIDVGLKAETKMLVNDIVPRDEFGCYLSKDADDPVLRRPVWVMDELFRKLRERNTASQAQKATRFASRFLHRQRLKQCLAISGRGSEKEVETLNFEFAAWKDGPYGKAWIGGMKERPPRMLVQQLSKSTGSGEDTFDRYYDFHFIYNCVEIEY